MKMPKKTMKKIAEKDIIGSFSTIPFLPMDYYIVKGYLSSCER